MLLLPNYIILKAGGFLYDSCQRQEEKMEKDFVSSSFFSDNERYADIINGIGCDGVPFVRGRELQELDIRVSFGR